MGSVANRRIVVLCAQGPYAGLYCIMGREDQLAQVMHIDVFPAVLEGVGVFGREVTVHLAEVNERYVLYRESVDENHAAESVATPIA